MTDLDNEISGIIVAHSDGGLFLEEAVEMAKEAMVKDGYKKTKYKWEYDQEGDMHNENDSRN